MQSPLMPRFMHTAPSARFFPPVQNSAVSLQTPGDDDEPNFALHEFLAEVTQNLSSDNVCPCGKNGE